MTVLKFTTPPPPPCSNMVANSLPVDPSPLSDPRVANFQGLKVKIQLFQIMVMLHIKLKGMKNAATCKHIFCPFTQPRPLGWGQKVKIQLFQNMVMLHIKLKGMMNAATCKHCATYSVLSHTLTPGVGLKYFFLKEVIAYQVIGNAGDFLPISSGRILAPFPIENSHLFSQYHV